MKIHVHDHEGLGQTVIDTDGMEVEITENFTGVRFDTADDEHLAVAMRDSGFEVRYWTKDHDLGWFDFKGGHSPTEKDPAILGPELDTRIGDSLIWLSNHCARPRPGIREDMPCGECPACLVGNLFMDLRGMLVANAEKGE